MITLLIMDAFNASITGFITAVLAWMWCHRRMYSWRDFGVMILLLTSMVLRFVKGTPPHSHFIGIMTMNTLFVLIAALIWARPSRIPVGEKKQQCIIFRVLADLWWLVRGKKDVESNG